MSELEIVNPIPVDEVRPWLTAHHIPLLAEPHGAQFERRVEIYRRAWIPERTWGVRDGGRWVATLATDPQTMTVPGFAGATTVQSVDALTAVTVSATHRRRGLLTRMITDSLAAARERGDALAALIAAEWPIYGRFGYAPAVGSSDYVYRPRMSTITPSSSGAVRSIDPVELAEHAGSVFARARRERAGHMDRQPDWWSAQLGLDGYAHPEKRAHWLVHDGPDGVDGLVSWRVTRDFEITGRLGAIEVGQLLAATAEAYRDIWAYLAGIDAVGEIALHQRPVDEQARWLLADGRALRQGYTGDWLWLRLLDVPAALAARGYAGSGTLVLDVVDGDLGTYGTARVRLDTDGTAATCAPTAASADLRLSQRALASVYLGGHTLREIALGGGVDELTPGSLSRADALFATALHPWNATGF